MQIKNKIFQLLNSETKVSKEKVSLKTKQEEFINWYLMQIDENSSKTYHKKEIENLIEKIAVWFELRYPDIFINEIFSDDKEEHDSDLDRILKDKIKDQLELKWQDFYDYETFISCLSASEKHYLLKYEYPSIVYLKNGGYAHFHLNKEGYVTEDEYVSYALNLHNTQAPIFEGRHMKECLEFIKQAGKTLPKNNEIERVIEKHDLNEKIKQGILDCAMYRIIERGKNRLGPKRAFLFAKEFNRNIEIPLQYGIDSSDPSLRYFLNEYIKAGGKKDLICYENYCRKETSEKLEKVTIEELLKTTPANCLEKYTKEEMELYQRLVNILSCNVEHQQKVKTKK